MATTQKKETDAQQGGDRLAAWLLLLAAPVVFGAFYLFDPAQVGWFLKCPMHEWTGLHCPGCGGQRAIHALLQGDIAAALSFNLVAVLVILPVLGYQAMTYILAALGGLRLPELTLHRRSLYLFVGLLAVFGVLRNLPWAPFTILAP